MIDNLNGFSGLALFFGGLLRGITDEAMWTCVAAGRLQIFIIGCCSLG